MSHFPLVYISSDSDGSSDSEISYHSDSEFEDPGWTDYFPPAVTSSSKSVASSTITDAASTTNSKPRKKKNVPSTSLANELPYALTQALESAIQNMKWPAPRKEKPP